MDLRFHNLLRQVHRRQASIWMRSIWLYGTLWKINLSQWGGKDPINYYNFLIDGEMLETAAWRTDSLQKDDKSSQRQEKQMACTWKHPWRLGDTQRADGRGLMQITTEKKKLKILEVDHIGVSDLWNEKPCPLTTMCQQLPPDFKEKITNFKEFHWTRQHHKYGWSTFDVWPASH